MARALDIPWDKIKADYISGVKPAELVKKYNVKYDTLTTKINRNKWTPSKKKYVKKVNETVCNFLADTDAQEIIQMKMKERKLACSLQDAITSQLYIKDKGKEIINPLLDTKKLNDLSTALERIQKILYKSHGIADKIDANVKGHLSVVFDKEDEGVI